MSASSTNRELIFYRDQIHIRYRLDNIFMLHRNFELLEILRPNPVRPKLLSKSSLKSNSHACVSCFGFKYLKCLHGIGRLHWESVTSIHFDAYTL